MNKEILISHKDEYYKVKPSKIYEEYGVAITKIPEYINGKYVYTLTDIDTGFGCGKTFSKVSDAKSFMEHTEEFNFRRWLNALNEVRSTDTYKALVQRRKEAKV